MNGVEQAFTAEAAILDDGKRTTIEGEMRRVGDPKGAKGNRFGRRPKGDALSLDGGLEDGDESGAVARDGDGIGEIVGEEVVEGGGGGVGVGGAGGNGLVGLHGYGR